MNRVEAVNRACARHGRATYVEIGVRAGETLRRVVARTRIGVDPNFIGRRLRLLRLLGDVRRILRIRNGQLLFSMPSDEFFTTHSKLLERMPIDVALIDGLHTYEQSLRDVLNCVDHVAEGGVIFVHDCNPLSVTTAAPTKQEARKRPDYDGSWQGEVYKTIVRLRSTRPDLHVCVLDCDWGLGVVTRDGAESMLPLSEPEIAAMKFADIAQDRARLLNLKPPEYLEEILSRR